MGILVIKDLPESVDLDKQAMAAFSGGARVASRETLLAPRPFIAIRIGAATSRAPVAETSKPPRPTLLR
ncbi:hypothetical protein SAMN05421548_13527 [Paraburkholderia lycopersici]|uniref:Uncharacterized protein n=2 Tax=Paraburkholderia lycopersici TaxID=416944 RepID=A0A1G7AS90_9BURK|nr:hypothetical protein SAMN05421548_13527 [Paraburkholderia lycopersici]